MHTTTKFSTVRSSTRCLSALCAPLALGAALLSGSAWGQGTADIDAQYRQDVARCNSGQTHQDRTTCLREAGAARDEARRGRLQRGATSSDYQRNAVNRCERLPESQRQDCITATTNPTKTYGSIGSGGVLRESVTTIPAEPAAPSGSSMPSSTMPAAPSMDGASTMPVK